MTMAVSGHIIERTWCAEIVQHNKTVLHLCYLCTFGAPCADRPSLNLDARRRRFIDLDFYKKVKLGSTPKEKRRGSLSPKHRNKVRFSVKIKLCHGRLRRPKGSVLNSLQQLLNGTARGLWDPCQCLSWLFFFSVPWFFINLCSLFFSTENEHKINCF